ncbi:helix-turn-helix domain-containing protein [Aquisalibacillus elongatus]|uniref:Uncharacterized protein YpbB n=1 Tax=Aquisalibacillus elongatus TaxID=485577 RepID=A0A3N5BE51_9BACI|nr:helix-turn-helix domain-containing protein [Aquisalibacillus elongatus]RPF55743.1 uncharacterized protein YpbB [Aquisalibacillus elongatus]
MIQFNKLLLYMLSRLDKQRTISSAFHILRGKKSAQTIQDIHLFQMQHVFGVYQNLDPNIYHKWIQYFKDSSWLTIDEDTYTLTDQGYDVLNDWHDFTISGLNGFKYHRIDRKWDESVKLLVQTLSNLSYGDKYFIPVTDDLHIQFRVKQLIKKYQQDKKLLTQKFTSELYQVLHALSDEQAAFISKQLTGYNRIGLSKVQLAEEYDLLVDDIHITHIQIIHQMLKIIESDQQRFPILNSIIPVQNQQYGMTESAFRTFQLIEKGYTLPEIESLRQLKTSTIHDHVVEIATRVDHFDIGAYVDQKTIDQVGQVINKSESRRLKDIKLQLDEAVTYFQIRLVLAKFNQIKESVSI